MSQRDSDLLRLLRVALQRGDPVPERVLSDAQAAFSHRSREVSAVADLTSDSVLDTDGRHRVSPGADLGARFLEFHHEDLTIRLEVSPHDGLLRLNGQLSTGGVAELRVARPSGDTPVSITAQHTFTTKVAPGPLRLLCHFPPPMPPIATTWTVL
ncbi:hypothetical protein J4H86_07240 [Spiractinospora alimapuensis]|uniref:hypothetical protein n=1 Tax=Spiractinospora alimapuensis TaxID=2820884 RepID=UPI001F16FF81|nr:hypothetical protein [Spiractinospora alimapuensis]QVQ53530.1 hypothetical protein J4H86_07240 [Spiractinospora alimapuensis]